MNIIDAYKCVVTDTYQLLSINKVYHYILFDTRFNQILRIEIRIVCLFHLLSHSKRFLVK